VGGGERVTINLASGLLNAGVAVDLLVCDATGVYGSSLPDGVRLVDLKAGRVLAAVPALARYLRSERPRAYLSAMNHANVISIWAKQLAGYRGKVVLVEHNDLVRAFQVDALAAYQMGRGGSANELVAALRMQESAHPPCARFHTWSGLAFVIL